MIPHTRPSAVKIYEEPKGRADLRIRHLVQDDHGQPVQVGLLGVPSDLGVVCGGGRAGAALGPDAIRRQLSRYGTAYNFELQVDLSLLTIVDFGDVVVDEASSEKTHQRLAEAVGAILSRGAIPVVLGGGHDLTFGGVRGLAGQTTDPMGGIALDAHFDVREAIDGMMTSGTPFRNILENIDAVRGDRFVEIGSNGLVNAKGHFDYLCAKRARIFSLSEVRRIGIGSAMEKALDIAGRDTQKVFCSIDLDCIAQAYAPGVSAPSPEGLYPEEVTSAAYAFGRHPKAAYLDIMEMNPHYDQDDRTARLAAALILHFLAGVAMRHLLKKKVIGFQKGESHAADV